MIAFLFNFSNDYHECCFLCPRNLDQSTLTVVRSRAGSDSDLSQISSTNANSFPFMNTMQQSLGVMLSASPLVMLITSLRTSTRDSFDGTSKTSAINVTASVENINFSMNYKQFNKTAAEVGDLHLDLLLKVRRMQSSI